MRYSHLVVVLVCFLASAVVAEEARTTIGVLTCTLADGTSDKGSKITCGFKPTGTAADEKYNGTLQGLGHLPGGKQVLVWAVVGPATTKHPAGFLAQRYVKAEVAGQSPSWIGETNSAIVLQFESHGNEEFARAITQIDLKVSGTSA